MKLKIEKTCPSCEGSAKGRATKQAKNNVDLMTTEEVCNLFRNTPRTINRWRNCKKRKFPDPVIQSDGAPNLYDRAQVMHFYTTQVQRTKLELISSSDGGDQ